MNIFYTTMDKPDWVKEQEAKGLTVLHNAARPLYGEATEDTWAMPFIRGRHYAALDPGSPDFATRERLNEDLDASQIVFVDERLAYETGLEFYKVYLGDRTNIDITADKYRQDVIRKGLEVMNGFETLED